MHRKRSSFIYVLHHLAVHKDRCILSEAPRVPCTAKNHNDVEVTLLFPCAKKVHTHTRRVNYYQAIPFTFL